MLDLLYYYDYKGYKKNRELWYKVVLVLFILIAGLRYRIGIDTVRYLYDYYHDTPTLYSLKFGDLNIANNPLWKILNSFFYTLGAKYYIVQLVESAFVNILIFKYVKKHTSYIFTSVLLYFLWMYASYSFEAMKAGFSMALCLFANDYFLDKKWVKFVLISLLAFLFHPSSIIITFFSCFTFLKINKMGLLILCITFFVGGMLQLIYGDLILAFSFNDYLYNKAAVYGESDRYFTADSNRNVVYYAVHYVFIVLPSLLSFWVVKNKRNLSLLKFEPYLFLALFFVTMSANIYLFFRIYYFYTIYIILFISQAIVDLWKGIRFKLSFLNAILILLPFIVYMYYSYVGDRWMRYYPYASVVEKTINHQREKMYKEIRSDGIVPMPKKNEY